MAASVRPQRGAFVRVFLPIVVLALLIGGGAWTFVSFRNQPPEVPFAHVLREPIASSVPTNGRVEPIEWAEARSEHAGPVKSIFIQRGAVVAKDASLVELDSAEANADFIAAQSKVSQIRAELEVIDKGGRAVDLTTIASDIDREKLEFVAAQKDFETLSRLQSKQAATAFDVTQAKDRMDRAQAQIHALEQRRSSLTTPVDRSSAEAKLRDAQSAVVLAEERIRKSIIRAPVGGTVYQFDLKPGAYLNAGESVATIGDLTRVRVKVFVDEPDLGRVAVGKPVLITWDARPGAQWKGAVDRTPTQIVAMGTRQVGEVICVIDNPKGELLPGTNVNAEIRSEEVASALTIPKEAVRHENNQMGVYTLSKTDTGEAVAWKKISLGLNNTTRTQVEGLSENDAVALPSEKTLKNGMSVHSVFR